MENKTIISYTQRMRSAVDMRDHAEHTLKKAMVSLKYINIDEQKYLQSLKHIERCKELVISGNIILKSIRETEHIGELYNESFDDVMELFDSALREVQKVLVVVDGMRK